VNLIRYTPAPPLDRYIECFWWSLRDEPQNHGEHMLPSGRAQLVIALHENPILCYHPDSHVPMSWSGGVVHGPQTSHYLAGPKPKGVTVGVSFRPGAAGALLGASMAELIDRHVALDAIWGKRGAALCQRLMSAVGPKDAFRILEESLSAPLHRPLLMHPSIAQTLARGTGEGLPRIAEAQHASGFSARHFIALFRAAVGMSPKHFSRIQRFNSAVRSLAAADKPSLSDVAATAGYSDQAHLTREFREFAGVTPTQYRPSSADRPLHHRAAPRPTR
jgi:AraC-like DNA-binding protein